MGSMWKYIVAKWNKFFATTPEEKYPALDNDQKKYRKEFDGIVDKYLIYYDSKRDKDHPEAYHCIVYIDADNDIDWQIDDGEVEPSAEYKKQRKAAISKLNIEQAMPVQNLSEEEVFTFKKLLGEGYNAALAGNFDDVDMAITEAEKYRSDRNKERSRWLLLSAASMCLIITGVLYALFFHYTNRPYFELISGVVMGAVGSYVSIWSRYGKMDMTGLGTRWLHYLEAISRMAIGAIFAFIIICALKSGLVLQELNNSEHLLSLYMALGFIAGFSEKFVPSVLESFVNKSENNQ